MVPSEGESLHFPSGFSIGDVLALNELGIIRAAQCDVGMEPTTSIYKLALI